MEVCVCSIYYVINADDLLLIAPVCTESVKTRGAIIGVTEEHTRSEEQHNHFDITLEMSNILDLGLAM